MSDYNVNRARSLLAGYFRTVYAHTGIGWDGDNDAEIADLIDNLIDAAQPGLAPAQPDPLTRIAAALERVADQLTAANVEIAGARKREAEIKDRMAEPPF